METFGVAEFLWPKDLALIILPYFAFFKLDSTFTFTCLVLLMYLVDKTKCSLCPPPPGQTSKSLRQNDLTCICLVDITFTVARS